MGISLSTCASLGAGRTRHARSASTACTRARRRRRDRPRRRPPRDQGLAAHRGLRHGGRAERDVGLAPAFNAPGSSAARTTVASTRSCVGIQNELFDLGSELATPARGRSRKACFAWGPARSPARGLDGRGSTTSPAAGVRPAGRRPCRRIPPSGPHRVPARRAPRARPHAGRGRHRPVADHVPRPPERPALRARALGSARSSASPSTSGSAASPPMPASDSEPGGGLRPPSGPPPSRQGARAKPALNRPAAPAGNYQVRRARARPITRASCASSPPTSPSWARTWTRTGLDHDVADWQGEYDGVAGVMLVVVDPAGLVVGTAAVRRPRAGRGRAQAHVAAAELPRPRARAGV